MAHEKYCFIRVVNVTESLRSYYLSNFKNSTVLTIKIKPKN